MNKTLTNIYRELLRILPDKPAVYLIYFRGYRRVLNLKNPTHFGEKIQWLKLYGHLDELSDYVDKEERNIKMKVLVIGPSPTKSKGGMATVIDELKFDSKLNEQFDIDVYESYIDGGIFKRLFYFAWAYLKFCFTKKDYDIYHIQAASYGSTFRKGWYAKTVKKWEKKLFSISTVQSI